MFLFHVTPVLTVQLLVIVMYFAFAFAFQCNLLILNKILR